MTWGLLAVTAYVLQLGREAGEASLLQQLQASEGQVYTWKAPGLDQLGRPFGVARLVIAGINRERHTVTLRLVGSGYIVWDLQQFAFEFCEGRLILEPAVRVLVRGDDDEPLAVACLECGGFALDTVSKCCVECGWRSRVAR